MPTVPTVNIVTALCGEAAPIRDALGLRRVSTEPFEIYEGAGLRLVISGVGTLLSAAAVGFVGGRDSASGCDIWINCGIAGHRNLALGTPVLADRVTSATAGRSYYPTILFDAPCRTGTVSTHDYPVTAYPSDACCDMEAAGFVTAAAALTHSELVHVLKIVSDNAASSLHMINRERVRALMRGGVTCLTALVERVRTVAALLPPALDQRCPAGILQRWRFTHAQSEQLRRLHQRYEALTSGAGRFGSDLNDCRSASEVLGHLEAVVDSLPLRVLARE